MSGNTALFLKGRFTHDIKAQLGKHENLFPGELGVWQGSVKSSISTNTLDSDWGEGHKGRQKMHERQIGKAIAYGLEMCRKARVLMSRDQ